MTCKKAVSKSPTRMRSRIARVGKVSLFKYKINTRDYICSFELARSASSAIIKHADTPSEKRSRFHPKRAAGKKHHAEHARDSKAFSVCEPDVGDAVHCRTRTQRLPQSPCTQSPRPDHADAKDPDYGCPDLWRDSRRHVDVDRTNDRGTRFSRRTLSECFEKRTDLCLAGARRFDDRCPYCRWRHCDFGGPQRCAERRYRGGFN